jgi:hypothetical protein
MPSSLELLLLLILGFYCFVCCVCCVGTFTFDLLLVDLHFEHQKLAKSLKIIAKKQINGKKRPVCTNSLGVIYLFIIINVHFWREWTNCDVFYCNLPKIYGQRSTNQQQQQQQQNLLLVL